jgi:hypothetical protein
VSPLTAGGLDPCLRLSDLAADVTAEYLRTGDDGADTVRLAGGPVDPQPPGRR